MLRKRTPNIYKLGGFAAERIADGAEGRVMVSGGVTSDDPQFYRMINHVSSLFLQPHGLSSNYVSSMLAVLHPDDVVDLYLNEEPTITMEIAAKRSMSAGTVVRASDIADIRRLRFANVSLAAEDKVLYCFKVQWKFGLFFDFNRPTPLDVSRVEFAVGELYRKLTFEHVYKTLESEDVAAAMFEAGWFPFIEIIEPDFEALGHAYLQKLNMVEEEAKLVARFDRERIERITAGWWRHPPFHDKRMILQAGIDAYLQDTPEGFVSCIKILGTEIEGVLRRQLLADTGRAEGGVKVLLGHLLDRGIRKSGSRSSLFFPEYFLRYLRDSVFASFEPSSIATGAPIPVGRHSVSHGAASPDAYTKKAALQMILVLDQIRFFGG